MICSFQEYRGERRKNNNKKKKKKKQVRFNEKVTIHYLYSWQFAYNQARKSTWREIIADRMRFQRRIQTVGELLIPIIKRKLNAIYCKIYK